MPKPHIFTNQEDPLWYKDAIIYELHIKAFKDQDGDGIGDFKGLIKELDYLQDLGVTAIWLLPFYPSPQRDGGYDISDYYQINSSYGNIKDFKKLLDKARKRGLKVITELVLNHTSDQHPWFQRARRAEPGSNYRDYYVWSDNPDKYRGTRIIFQDFEHSNWSWDPVANAYYWHRFYSHQPDLNFDNPAVQEEVFKIIDFWCNLGVDGFRLDAVPYLYEREGTNCENLPETHVFLKKLRKHLDANHTNKMFLAEANMWPEDSASYFGEGDECHMNYHFPIMPRLFMALNMEDRYPIIDIIDQTPDIPENCQWAMFLRNHDELTLEMVTDEERDYMYKAYTKDSLSKINLGIRHRLAPLLNNNRKKIELMNYLLFSLPGTPVIYYGDEIGMGDNVYLGDRDGVRTPMQWSPDRNAGFSGSNPQQLYLPIIMDPEYHFESVNVENQQKNLSSLLWWMKRVIDMRKRFKAFSRGDIKFLSPSNPKILAFTRTYEDETVLVVANLSRFSQSVEMDLSEFANYQPIEVFSQNKFPEIKTDDYFFTMSPHGYFWFLLEKAAKEEPSTELKPEQIRFKNPEELFKGNNKQVFEEKLLKNYFKRSKWFNGSEKIIQDIDIEETKLLEIDNQKYLLTLITVTFNEGFPDLYFLPVAFGTVEQEHGFSAEEARTVIAHVYNGDQEAIIYDAAYSEHFRNYLLQRFARKGRKNGSGLEFQLHPKAKISRSKTGENTDSAMLTTQGSGNVSVIYANKYFLKLYRRFDNTINPDIEVIRFLTEHTSYQNVPRYLGAIEYKPRKDPKKVVVLGILQDMIPNNGNAWDILTDSINRHFERVMAERESLNASKVNTDFLQLGSSQHAPEWYSELIGTITMDRVKLLGQRVAELHKALASHPEMNGFEPEEFSLHYQRSLFSSMQSLVRKNFQELEKGLPNLTETARHEAEAVLAMRPQLMATLKRIFSRKMDATKIRTHGDLQMHKALFTGKDFYIIDFEGEPTRSFSEKRLKKSAMRDVASMIRSLHYAAYNSLFHESEIRREDTDYLRTWADRWYNYISSQFLKAYLEHAQGQSFVPKDPDELQILLETFLIERSVDEIGREMATKSKRILLPLINIRHILEYHQD